MKKIFLIIYICTLYITVVGQTNNSNNRFKRPEPWAHLREADISYHWRVERIIDTREKMNKSMSWPKNPLWQIIETHIMEGNLNIYSDEQLKTVLDNDKLRTKLNYKVNIDIQLDPNNPYEVVDSEVTVIFDWSNITRYKIMEDWIFNKKEGKMYCRIAWIAPMYQPQAGGLTVPEQPIGYIKYYDVNNKDSLCFRNVCARQPIFNPKNQGAMMSYDNFFEMRMFSSYITMESNVFDASFRNLDEYKDDPIAQLLASEKAKENLFLQEQDSWEH